jgi:hypothetical protein
MAILLSGEGLKKRLQQLVMLSERIDVAVAWATPSEALNDLLSVAQKSGASVVRMLVGVSGYVTHPEALRKIHALANLRVYGEPNGVLFHPKLYIFHTSDTKICWVGSANLTPSGFGKNVEVVAELTDVNGIFHEHFMALYQLGDADFDIDAYSLKWEEESRKRPRFLDDEKVSQSGPIEQANTTSSEILFAGWVAFASELKATADLGDAISTLRAGYKLVRRPDWKLNLTEQEVDIMLGKRGTKFTHFGELTRISEGYFRGESLKLVNKRLAIHNALSLVIDKKLFQPDLAEKAYENLKSLDGCGSALATRLLLFARPDWFVVVNERSFSWLTRTYHVSVSRSPTGREYANLIIEIQKQEWWKAPQPTNESDSELWQYRAALTDLLAQKNRRAED